MKRLELFANGIEIPIDYAKFPGGEVRIRVNTDKLPPGHIHIKAVILSSDEIMGLIMLTDAVRRMGATSIRLTMPYIPYARQDRVCSPGDSFSLAAFAGIINSLLFDSIIVYDPHSPVSVDLIERCVVLKQGDLLLKHKEAAGFIQNSISQGIPTYLVAPDKGAVTRTSETANLFPGIGVIFADKTRDPKTGAITGMRVLDAYTSKIEKSNLIVVDDICDGGRTFIELGKVLAEYNPQSLNLYVTHGIFSQGLEVLQKPGSNEDEFRLKHLGRKQNCGYYDHVWCTVNFKDYQNV